MFDIIVMGGGPAGVTAALRARELGATVALVEKGRLGGTCTNDGCVPTRVLARTARMMRDAHQFAHYGLVADTLPTVDIQAVLSRAQEVVYEIHEKKQLLYHLETAGVKVYDGAGNAAFVGPNHIQLEDGVFLEGKQFILCVGGSARRLPFPGGEYALTHSDVWSLNTLPQSVAIVGGGATGCQLASIMEAFGSKVTLLDAAPQILIAEDSAVSQTVTEEFIKHGIDVVTGIDGIERIERHDEIGQAPYMLVYNHNQQQVSLSVDSVILAVGWPGNISGLGLDNAGVEFNRNYIQVDDTMRTSASHIYAAGDITGKMMLVQSAGYQARVAVENALLGIDHQAVHKLVPHGGFTNPEYGSVGLTEQQATERYDILTSTVPYADLDRAVIDGRTVGFCKLIVDKKTHLLLGAHVVGEQAVEVVQMVAAGMASDLTVEKLANLEIAYPTFAAVVGLAAREMVRELGSVPITPEWRALADLRPAEWERRVI